MKTRMFTPLQIIATVAGVTLIRTFLENFSNPEPVGGFTSFALVVNYFLYYLAVVISLGIVLALFAKQPWMKMISRVTYFLPIIWIVPIIDMLYSGGACLAYISSTGWTLVRDVANFFTGPFVLCGISMGLRIELALISLGLGIYIFKKTNSWIRAVAGGITEFLVIMAHSTIPGIIATIAGTQLSVGNYFQEMFGRSLMDTVHTLGNQTGMVRYLEHIAFFMGRIPWIVIALLALLVFWKESPAKFRAWMRNARVTRVVYYFLIMAAGTAFALHTFDMRLPMTLPDILAYIMAAALVPLSCWLGVVINDLADQDLDAINAQNRPLIQKTLSPSDMRMIGWATGTLIATGAILINWNFFILVVLWQVAYALYSLPPLQLKRHWIFSSLLVGIAGTVFALAGYFLVAPDQTFTHIPFGAVAMVWLSLAIMSNTKDFKDVKGDRELGIKTLPAVYGSRRAGAFLVLTLIAWIAIAAIILRNEYIFLLALPWIVLDLIIRKRVPEYVRFLIVFVQIIALVLILTV